MSNMMGMQMMGIASMKENVSLYHLLFGFAMMQMIQLIPEVKKFVSTQVKTYFKNKVSDIQEKIINNVSKEIKSCIRIDKLPDEISMPTNVILINAINNYISNLDTSKYLCFTDDFYVTNKTEFEISPNIFCKIMINKMSLTSKKETKYIIKIYSYTYGLEHLRRFIKSLIDKYNYEQNNKLGNKKFYFDELAQILPRNIDGSIRYDTARPNLSFTMYPFITNKSLKNVFGNHLSIIKQRVDLFINKPEWYENKGIPHTLGIMMYGPDPLAPAKQL